MGIGGLKGGGTLRGGAGRVQTPQKKRHGSATKSSKIQMILDFLSTFSRPQAHLTDLPIITKHCTVPFVNWGPEGGPRPQAQGRAPRAALMSVMKNIKS